MNTRVEERHAAYRACPTVDRPKERAHQGVLDALEFVGAVRERDPREVWGTLTLWAERDWLRVFAVVTALAAMVPPDRSVGDLLAWTEELVPARGAA